MTITDETGTMPKDLALKARGVVVKGVPSLANIVEDINLDLPAGRILGLVGESGSGKSTLGLAMLRYCKRGTVLDSGSIEIDGDQITGLGIRALQQLRGRKVTYIPQSPAAALNPALRIGTQLDECLPPVRSAEARKRIATLLGEVGLPEDRKFLRRYPHQLSGGQQQRIAIAMAFLSRPDLIVLDEPTTGLDVSTQAKVLATIREMCGRHGAAGIYISHDMAVVADIADDIAVMYSGKIVEYGRSETILRTPKHPYTAALLLATPDPQGRRAMSSIPGGAPSPLHRPDGCSFAPRCPAAQDVCGTTPPETSGAGTGHEFRCHFPRADRLHAPVLAREDGSHREQPVALEVEHLVARYGRTPVLHDLSLSIPRGGCLALLGESGSGKTTLARSLAGLHKDYAGTVRLGGEELARSSYGRTPAQRRTMQYVFQDPYESLNPRQRVRDLLLRPLRTLGKPEGVDLPAEDDDIVVDALAHAALRPDIAARYPDQLSGGERQRVAIARALVTRPDVLICDEVTSALDVSVQAAIVELLHDLQEQMGLTLLFVTHNIALVRNIADDVAVLSAGRIVEEGTVESIFADPRHGYTRTLLSDVPTFELSA